VASSRAFRTSLRILRARHDAGCKHENLLEERQRLTEAESLSTGPHLGEGVRVFDTPEVGTELAGRFEGGVQESVIARNLVADQLPIDGELIEMRSVS